MMHPHDRPSKHEEKLRYELHNNDIYDPRYRKFVSPIVNSVVNQYPDTSRGLDFGAGTGPVISKMLGDLGYSINLYDPFFHNDKDVLNSKYDFIVCCEVIEHFHQPAREFGLLRSLLEKGGSLICMTEILQEETEFESWYYKNDETHVIFYQERTLEWIKNNFSFSDLLIDGRLVVLKA